MFNLKNKEELYTLLTRTPDGIEWENLKDCYKGIDTDLEELVRSRKILRIFNNDSKADVVYPNDLRFTMTVDYQFKELWNNVKIPDVVDLEKEMQKVKIKE